MLYRESVNYDTEGLQIRLRGHFSDLSLTDPKPAPLPSSSPEAEAEQASDRLEPLSPSYIERAAREMAARRPRRPGAALNRPIGGTTQLLPAGHTTLTVEMARMRQVTTVPLPGAPVPPGVRAPFRPTFDDHFRLTLTRWQSAGLAVAIAALVVGALGMAASGWVAAYHWSCRAGLATTYCAPPPAPSPSPRPEIPT